MGETRSFGISMEHDTAEKVEAPLGYGDNRSERIVELMTDGLEVEQVLGQLDTSFESPQDRRAYLRQCILDQHRREREDEDSE